MEYIKLSDVTLFVRNGASIKQDKYCKEGYPITRIETLSNGVFNYEKLGYASIFDESYSDYYLEENDVLLSHINSEKFLGRSVTYTNNGEGNIIHGMNLLNVRFKQNKYLPKYFEWYTKTEKAKLYFKENTKHAVNQASITSTAIKNMPVPKVDLLTQSNVVYSLESINKLIKLKEKIILQLNELIKSRFIEMFGDAKGTIDFNDVIVDETKKGFKFDSSFYMKTGEVAIVDQGKDLICGYKDMENDKPPYIKECIIFGDHTEIFKHIAFPVYLGADGTKILKVNDGWNTLYVYEYLKIFYTPIGGYSRHFKFLKEQLFSKPDIKMQNEFADFVKLIDKSKFILQKQIKDLEELLQSKMDEYFG